MTKIYEGTLSYRSKRTSPLVAKAYSICLGQQDRCNSPNHYGYKNYGAKGIRVEYSPREFVSWCIDNPLFTLTSSIGRIDHAKNYCFSNIEVLSSRSENTKERNARLGNPMPSVRVHVVDRTTNSILSTEDSLRAASRKTGVKVQTIKRHCEGRLKYKSSSLLTFRYVVAGRV